MSAGLKILIAEDDARARDYLCTLLKDEGYQVETAADGTEAWRLLLDARFEGLLLDVQMPDLDGFEVLAQAAWLRQCHVHYWGDIDTHGFAILDRLRAHLPHARSLLMDRATLLEFEVHWGVEDTPTQRDLIRLNDDERATPVEGTG